MAVLSNIDSRSLAQWGTPAAIQSSLIVKGTKVLRIASDALTDRSVVNPEEAYVVESS